MTETVLRVDRLSAFYGNLCAVRDVSFDVARGETVCVIGPNGAGKTTLLKAISGTLAKTTGTLQYRGEATTGLAPESRVSRGLIHVPEGRQVFTSMTVEENIEMGAYSRRSSSLKADIEEALKLFPGIPNFAVCIGYVRLCDRIIGPDPQAASAVPQEREEVAR